jgi:hypothetical protein
MEAKHVCFTSRVVTCTHTMLGTLAVPPAPSLSVSRMFSIADSCSISSLEWNVFSLGHNYDPATGKVNPSEVSVCFNGARSGSRLYKET